MKELIQKLDEVIDKLSDITDAVEYVSVRPIDFWIISDLAAIEKAASLGLTIHPEWSVNDLRYKLYQMIYGGE